MTRPRLEVADVFRRHGPAWRAANEGHLSPAQRRVMSAVELCRTVALGGHVERCEDCAHTRVAYNSCRDRHCPKCQWAVKQALRRHLAAAAFRDPALALLDSLPVPACRFARAHRCRNFRGFAAFGYDALAHQTCYGFRLHLRVTWPRPTGPSRPSSSPAGRSRTRATGARPCAPSWPPPGSPCRAAARQGERDLPLAGLAGADAAADRDRVLSQLTERYHAKRVRARDEWHLVARWLRKLASHTLAVLLCQRADLDPLAFAQLLTG